MSKKKYNTYNIKRAKILLKGFIPSLFSMIFPKNKNRIIFNSTRNEFYNFNTKYLFEYFIEHHPEVEAKFVINDENKREELNREFGDDNKYFIETESWSGMWYALCAGAWITSAFETPAGGVFLKFNRLVYLLGHGTHFKAIVFNENGLSYAKWAYYQMMRLNFSRYLVTSKVLMSIYKKAYKCTEDKLVVAGEPRHDKIYTPDKGLMQERFGSKIEESKNILYAPTWRPDGGLKLFPFDDMNWGDFVGFLEDNNINIFLRMHPSFQEDLEIYTKKTKHIKILDNQVVEDVSDVLGFFDLLITDYSSIHISFLLLDKPVMFLPYDFKQYNRQMGFVEEYDRLTPGPKPKTMKAFKSELTRLLADDEYYKIQRDEVSRFFNDFHYDNCKMNAEYIIKKIQEGKV